MQRLVQPDFAAARQADGCRDAPRLLLELPTGDVLRLQRALTTYLPRFNQLAERLGIDPVTEK